ncbi:fatty acid hydroperoxide lyase, chloroplastic [Cucurbita pepo subsp. pepo]|uniref:fatty acid hydroperoxide lyase, chloroplastic n=1 Tax=Cucurbita pepo subsp. pepo TaxID=3664 RepID=UPI000C9D2907|nr:fatty acid hydroperoxide lyase, chloroplastic [Cucurbita pepo subsp. pepo]
MSTMVAMASGGVPSIPSSISPPPVALPLKNIPGSHGLPLFGSIADRLDYFWFQGPDKFFRSRIEKNRSTVFRTNVPPSFPFILSDPKVIAVLDCKSFAHLFDMEVVEKKNVLVGDFMPSTSFTGNMRVCAYLDPSESQHSKIKNFTIDILRRSSKIWIPELESNLSTFWDGIESEIANNQKSSYRNLLQPALFNFFSKTLAGADTAKSPEVAKSAYIDVIIWLGLQLVPTIHLGVFQPLEEIFLHSFRLPFFPIAGRYRRLYDFIEKEGEEVVQRGVSEFGLKKEEAIHNLIFALGFNAYGGFSLFLPVLMDRILNDRTGLQQRIVDEVRAKSGSGLTFESVKEMELVYSLVYETLRLDPPVPTQYARARKDFKLSSHDAVFEIKKGELLCGYQPLVMRDPNVFEEPEAFKPDRFREEKGAALLDYLFWSNGPQTGMTSEHNKQCAAKDLVVLTAVVFVAYIFRRYDSIAGEGGSITALQKPN